MAAYVDWSEPGQPYAYMDIPDEEKTPEQIAQALELEARKARGLDVTEKLPLERRVIPDGVFVADDVIPEELAAKIGAGLDRLAASCDDYHPGSGGRVLDLVHPALYCYVKGLSRLADGTTEVWTPPPPGDNSTSRYTWMPAEVDVDADGKATFASYINGLDPVDDATLIADIAAVLSRFLPQLEAAANYRLADSLAAGDSFDTEYLDGPRPLRGALRGRRLQVIVKAVDYVLRTPGEKHDGVWHIEGTRQEAIVASGIYYVSASEHMAGAGLHFRRPVSVQEAEHLMYNLQQNEQPYVGAMCTVELATVPTPPGRCLAFTNDLQHKLATLTNTAGTSGSGGGGASSGTAEPPPPARRRILCFFLVDPGRRIISTADVPDQRREKWAARAKGALREAAGKTSASGSSMPEMPEVAVEAITAAAAVGFSLEEAKEHRLALMRDRKYVKDAMNNVYARDLDLCEH